MSKVFIPLALEYRVQPPVLNNFRHSGFPSIRINLSPFTKDFRGGEQLHESIDNFCRPALPRGTLFNRRTQTFCFGSTEMYALFYNEALKSVPKENKI